MAFAAPSTMGMGNELGSTIAGSLGRTKAVSSVLRRRAHKNMATLYLPRDFGAAHKALAELCLTLASMAPLQKYCGLGIAVDQACPFSV